MDLLPPKVSDDEGPRICVTTKLNLTKNDCADPKELQARLPLRCSLPFPALCKWFCNIGEMILYRHRQLTFKIAILPSSLPG